jgi:hypothetical protein
MESLVAESREALRDDRRYLCVVHSDRPLQLEQCELNFLERRYERADRLPPREPFEALAPARTFAAFGGEVTVHDIGRDGRDPPRLAARLRPPRGKPQHAVWHERRLWVLGAERIEVYDDRLVLVATIEDPWLAGGHTIAPDARGHMLVSCSASDSVLVVDEAGLRVVDALRMPERLYGRNYELGRADSVVDHYIGNDAQLTHINSAQPWREGILTSALIPGAIGWFDRERRYHELLRGFVGCHGARAVSAEEFHFCDSCLGALVFADSRGRVLRRIATGSKWLHDAVRVGGDVYALALYDRRQVWFVDAATRETLYVVDCESFGSPQFLSC